MLDLKSEDKNVFKLCKKFYKIFLQKAQSKLDAEISGIKTKIANLKEVIFSDYFRRTKIKNLKFKKTKNNNI